MDHLHHILNPLLAKRIAMHNLVRQRQHIIGAAERCQTAGSPLQPDKAIAEYSYRPETGGLSAPGLHGAIAPPASRSSITVNGEETLAEIKEIITNGNRSICIA